MKWYEFEAFGSRCLLKVHETMWNDDRTGWDGKLRFSSSPLHLEILCNKPFVRRSFDDLVGRRLPFYRFRPHRVQYDCMFNSKSVVFPLVDFTIILCSHTYVCVRDGSGSIVIFVRVLWPLQKSQRRMSRRTSAWHQGQEYDSDEVWMSAKETKR